MTEADDAVANSISFEAKKDKCAQLQSGQWALTLKIHPQDVNQGLMLAVPGQRYMCVLVALGDDERPLKGEDTVPKKAHETKEKPKQKWDDMPPPQQAGILCADVEFQKWVTKGGNHPPDERGAKDAIYDHFNITSRADLCNFVGRWNVLVACYRADTQGQAEMRS